MSHYPPQDTYRCSGAIYYGLRFIVKLLIIKKECGALWELQIRMI